MSTSARLLEQALTAEVQRQLDDLLEADEGIYRIRALQREAKSFACLELRQEVERRRVFEPLYLFARDFLQTAGLSNESVKYYASLVPFYTLYKLRHGRGDDAPVPAVLRLSALRAD